jgi:hypothetical protein
MDRLGQEKELRLSLFGEFLLRQQFVKAGHERYLVYWGRKFLVRPVENPARNLDCIPCVTRSRRTCFWRAWISGRSRSTWGMRTWRRR